MRFTLFFLALLITACSPIIMNYNDTKITILDRSIEGTTLHISQKNLTKIAIVQRLFLSHTGEELVYETAKVDTRYKFRYTYSYILRTIFEAKSISLENSSEGIGFFTIMTKDNKLIYAVVKLGSKKSLGMVYGFSQENFELMMHKKTLKHTSTKTQIESKWNEKMILTGSILIQERERLFY